MTNRGDDAQALRTVVASSFRPTLPLVVAQASGALRRAGLRLDLRTPGSSDEQLAQLIAGKTDVAHTALDNVVTWSEAAPVRIIGLIDLGVAHELVASESLHNVSDLRGRTIGVDSTRSGFVVLLQAALNEAGLEPGAYEIKSVGGLGRRAQAFESGEVDACLLAGKALTEAIDQGKNRLLAVRDSFPGYPAITLVVNGSLDDHERETLTRYLSALRGAVQDSDVSAAAVGAVLGTEAAKAEAWLAVERARTTGVVPDAQTARRIIAESLTATGRIGPGDPIDHLTELLMEESAASA